MPSSSSSSATPFRKTGRAIQAFAKRNGTRHICPRCCRDLPPITEEWGSLNSWFWNRTLKTCCQAFLREGIMEAGLPQGWAIFPDG
jgi:hypothetical protein